MTEEASDALIFFGASGDLTKRKIFPAFQAMFKRGVLDTPIIGVAKSGGTIDQLRGRVRDNLEKHGGQDAAALGRFLERSIISTGITVIRRPSRSWGTCSGGRRGQANISPFPRHCSRPWSNR